MRSGARGRARRATGAAANCGGHRATGISSIFRMSNGVTDYEPLQVFDVVRPALWCTGWRNAHFAQMLLHQQVRWS